jgi:hypothetical protein
MKTIAAALLGLLVGSVGFAQPPGGGAGAMPDNATIFERNDANGDGEITQAEATAAETALGQNFAAFDTNSDGKVVASELDGFRQGAGGGAGGGGPGAGAPPSPPSPPAPPASDDDDDEDEDDDE